MLESVDEDGNYVHSSVELGELLWNFLLSVFTSG